MTEGRSLAEALCEYPRIFPPVYRSTATILIKEQEIPQEFVRSTVTSFADERIQVISQQVMTRSTLLEFLKELIENTKEIYLFNHPSV